METTLVPGWIYVANVLTYNGYEGVKIGGTEYTRGTPQKRINEHLRSDKFEWFELIEVHPVADVWNCETEIKERLNGTQTGNPMFVAPGFREVFTKNASPELIAELVVNKFNRQIEKAEAIGAKYRQIHNGEMINHDHLWPNRSGGRVAAMPSSSNWVGSLEASASAFKLIAAAVGILFCVYYIKEIFFCLIILAVICSIGKKGVVRRGRRRKYSSSPWRARKF